MRFIRPVSLSVCGAKLFKDLVIPIISICLQAMQILFAIWCVIYVFVCLYVFRYIEEVIWLNRNNTAPSCAARNMSQVKKFTQSMFCDVIMYFL